MPIKKNLAISSWLWRLRQGDGKFEASLGPIARLCLRTNSINHVWYLPVIRKPGRQRQEFKVILGNLTSGLDAEVLLFFFS